MSIERLLDQIRVRFDPQIAREVVSAFRAEPLVWHFLESTPDLEQWLTYASDDLSRWQPGVLALFSLDHSLVEQDLTDLKIDLPAGIIERVANAFEMTRLTGLEPTILPDAALLALHLREFRRNEGSWINLSVNLLSGKGRLPVWKTAFAVLPQLVPDFEAAVDSLIFTLASQHAETLGGIIVHQVIVSPADESTRYQAYQRRLQKAPVDIQISTLRAMRSFEDESLIKLLANSFLAQAQTANTESKQNLDKSEVETFRQQAVLSQIAGQPAQASRAIDHAFNALNRQQAEVLRDLAFELETSNPEEARKTWEEILRLQPDNPAYKNEYAEFLIANDDSDYGYEILSEIPDDATRALYALRYPATNSVDLQSTQSLDKALEKKTLQTTKSRFSSVSDNLKAARYAFENKKYQTASSFIRKALVENPNDLETIKLSGQIDRHMANIDEAIESSALLALFEPQNQTNKKDLASLYLQSQQPESALRIYQELINSSSEPSRTDLLNYAEISIKAAQAEKAIPIAQAFLKKDEFDGEALVLLCNALIATGRNAEANQYLERASAIAPEKPGSWLSLARIWTNLGQEDKAMQALRKAKAALPDDPEILSALGSLYLANDQPTEAISVLRQAFQLDPSSTSVRKSLSQAYLTHGYIDEAWTTIAPLEDDYTSDPELASVLGQTLAAMGDLNGAKPILRFAWQAKRSDSALKSYAELLIKSYSHGIKPGAQELKEMSQLLSIMEERQQERDGLFDMRLLQADLKATLGLHEAAYQDYLQLLDYPEARSPRSYHHLQFQTGQTALALGLTDISLASLQEAVLTDPDDLPTRHALAKAFMEANLQDEGFASARSAMQIAPTEIENVLWYSDFMSAHDNAREAIQVLKDTIHLRPDDKALYLTLARTYVNLNQIEDTKETLNQMLALEDIDTEEYVNVANLYLHMDQPEEASRIIKKAISDNPSPDFDESRDLVYSVLKLGDAAAALQLVKDLEPALQTNIAYPLLKSDVLAANQQFLPALETLEDILNKLEFAPETLGIVAGDAAEESLDYPPYNRSGLYYRAAQLERTIGDLVVSQKHAALALNADQESQPAFLLKLELALATSQSEVLAHALDFLNTQETRTQTAASTASILALDAVLHDDLPKARLLWEHFLADKTNSPTSKALQSLFALQNGNAKSAASLLMEALELLDELEIHQRVKTFDIARHFSWIWHALAVGKAAWEQANWKQADHLLETALSVVKINPIANKLLAEYLTDKIRQTNNAHFLHILTHAPSAFDPQSSDFDLIEEQISTAGRAIAPAELLTTLKINQALKNGHWSEENDLHKLITNGKQAAQVLSVLVDDTAIGDVLSGFSKDPDVTFQQAIQNLHTDPDTSSTIASKLLESQPDNPVLHTLKAIATRNQALEAAESLETALAIWPDESEWHAMAATMHQDAGQYPQAAKHLEEAIRLAPKDAQYWQMLGDVKMLEKDYHAAKDYFGKATDLFPSNPEALHSLAIINQQLGEHQIAIQCLRKASQLDPGNILYDEGIAQSLLATQELSEAMRQAEAILKSDPKNEIAWQVKVKTLLKSNKPEEARQAIHFALAVVENPVPFELQKIELDNSRNPQQAVLVSQKLAENYPENVAVLNNLAQKQIQIGEIEKAEQTLQRSLVLDQSNPETLVALGMVDRVRGNLDQALAHLAQAIELQPGLIEAYLEMGLTYQDRREISNAIQTYHKAIAMVSNDPRPYLQAAAAYKESRDYRNAEFMLRQASQLSPSDQNIRRQLAAVVALNIVNNLQETPKR
jgi:tetratricopeptide (TPR) repeat protein